MKLSQGKLKKLERKAKKEGLTPYYVMVTRIPNEKRLKGYTKLVTQEKADRLIDGSYVMGQRVPLSRKFVVKA